MTIEAIFLNTHYKYVALTTMNDIKATIDGDISMSKLLMANVTSIIAFLLTMYSLVGKLITWKGLDWECLFTSLFNFKVNFQDYLSLWLGCIFIHVSDYQLIPIFVQIPYWSLANTWQLLWNQPFGKMWSCDLQCFCMHFFFNEVRINVKKDVLGSQTLASLVQNTITSFVAN